MKADFCSGCAMTLGQSLEYPTTIKLFCWLCGPIRTSKILRHVKLCVEYWREERWMPREYYWYIPYELEHEPNTVSVSFSFDLDTLSSFELYISSEAINDK